MDFERDDLIQDRDMLLVGADTNSNMINLLVVFVLTLLCMIGVPDVSAAILKEAREAAERSDQDAKDSAERAEAALNRARAAEHRASDAMAEAKQQRSRAVSAEARASDAELEATRAVRSESTAKHAAAEAERRAREADAAARDVKNAQSSMMQTVSELRQRATAAELEIQHLRPRAIHVVLAIDGSASMGHVLEQVTQLTRIVGEVASRLATEFKLGVVVYRGVGNHKVFPLTTIGSGTAESPDPGMVSLRRFLSEKSMTVYEGTGGNAVGGERVGQKLGKSYQVTVLEPVNTPADFEGGVTAALGLFQGMPEEGRRLLAVMGDVSCWESPDGSLDTIEPAERRAAARIEDRIRDFAKDGKSGEVLMVFTGRGSWRTNLHTETIGHFRELAAAAGEGGRYTDELSELTGTLVEAVIERAEVGTNQ